MTLSSKLSVCCLDEAGEIMEDYEKFIQRRLYELKRKDSNDNNKNQRRTLESPCTRHGSSAIRFHGSPILPPLLTGVQREEMQRHREAAKRTMDRRKTRPSETRMSYVQNILHSVQLRQAPTLEEFFQGEPGLTAANTTNLHHSNVRQVLASQDDDVTETKDSLPGSSSPPTLTVMHDGKAGVRGPPMTLTAYGAFTTNHLTTLHNTTTVRETFLDKLVCDPMTPSLARETTTHTNQVVPQTETRTRERPGCDQDKTTNAECVLEEDLGSGGATGDPLADISHQSSGYVTCENAEATWVLSRTEAGESILSGPEEGTPVGMGGVLLHSTSDTNTTKACNIISHPPVDAEDLEEGSSPCDDDLITGRPADEASVTSSWCNDVIPDYLEEALVTWPLQSSDITPPVEDRRASHPGKKCSTANIVTFPQHQASLSLSDLPEPKIVVTCPQAEASTPDLCKPDQNQIQASDLDLDRPQGPYRLSLQTLLKKSQAALERPKPGRNQPGSEPKSQAGDVDLDPEPEAGPYRLSLQTLLKKSQEHRRRQRQLKNQAKASTCPTRTQEASTHQKMEEEMSFSDKENEEFLQSGRGVAEGRKTRDRDLRKDHLGMGVQFSGPPPLEIFPKEAWVQREEEKARSSIVERMGLEKGCREGILKELEAGNGPSHLVGLEEDTQSPPGVDIDASSAVEDIQLHLSPDIQLHLSPDIQLHLSPDVTAAPSTLMENLPHPISADASITQKSFYLVWEKSSTLPRPSSLGGSRFQTVPTPEFSMSPIRCKSKGDSGGGGRGTPKRQILVNTPLNVDNEVGSVTGQENDAWDQRHLHRAPLVAGGGISQGFTAPTTVGCTTPMRRSSDQAEQIAQLELNLSSLKILISDLESTLTETPESHQTHNNSQTDNNSNLTMEPPHKYMDYHTPESQAESNLTDSEKGRGDGGQRSADKMTVVPCRVQGCDSVPPLVKEVEITVTTGYKKQDGRQQQPLAARLVTSLTQKRRVSDVFRKVPYDVIKVPSEVIKVPSEVIKVRNDVVKIPASHKTPFSVLSDASNNQHQPMEWKSYPEDPAHFQSINQSYDVDTPSGLWLQGGSGSEGSLKGHDPAGKQLTPENGGGGQGGASRAKRRLVMHTTEGNRGGGRREVMDRPHSSTPEAAVRSHSQESQQLKQLQLTHAGQVRALKEEQRRQQQQLLQSPRCLSVCYGPLVAAAVKGYLTRRLLHTERVGQLLCTIKDTQQFLQSFQPQSPGRDSRQDLVLQERVTLQLRSARYEVQDIFCLSAGDRMQIISWDRQLARDREMRRKTGETGSTRGKTSLSAATQKALERKRGVMMRKAAEGQRGTGAGVVAGQKGPLAGAERQRGTGAGVVAGQKGPLAGAEGTGAGVVAGQKGPLAGAEGNVIKRIRGSFRPNPQRVPKTTQSRRSR
uniref:Centriolar coiled-coil protein of 110 kDa n=1 Tax=Oncorhynchus mykiss TaxID=8022 RepID=A0A8K9XFH4_ONCMY